MGVAARSSIAIVSALGCLFLPMTSAMAQQRNPLQTIGKTVAESDSSHYRFERFTVSSGDAQRTWRVHVGIPKTTAPSTGFPSFWMLDGNAALQEFDDALLKELAAQNPPQVLIFIGYDNQLRIDSEARNRDYTPSLTPAEDYGKQPYDLTGGADAFLEIIERKIRPQVDDRVRLDPKQQTLWAHSLGGLFALHTFFTRTGAFQTYVSGSPSMWWGQAYAVKEAERFVTHNAGRSVRIVIHLGGAERVGDRGPRDLTNPRVVAHLERIQAAPPDAAMQLAEKLKQVPGLDVSYREFPGLGHGPMFRASLMAALHDITGVADRSDTPSPGGIP